MRILSGITIHEYSREENFMAVEISNCTVTTLNEVNKTGGNNMKCPDNMELSVQKHSADTKKFANMERKYNIITERISFRYFEKQVRIMEQAHRATIMVIETQLNCRHISHRRCKHRLNREPISTFNSRNIR